MESSKYNINTFHNPFQHSMNASNLPGNNLVKGRTIAAASAVVQEGGEFNRKSDILILEKNNIFVFFFFFFLNM